MNNEVFIFAIGYNCGKILNKMLESFHKYHDCKIHLFGSFKDFKAIDRHSNNEYIDMSSDDVVKELFTNGHLGTSYIWTKVLKGEYGNYKKVIQIDSDVIFSEESLSEITTKFNEGYDLIGPRRSYENNQCNRNDVKGLNLPDVVSTYFLGINIEKISNYDFDTLHKMIVGYYNPRPIPIIDFFDPVSFDIIENGGKIYYLDNKKFGSSDESGSSDNGFLELNTLYDFGQKMIHFAGIGSGMNFYYNGNGNVPESYAEWAKKRFALFIKLFYNEEIDCKYDLNELKLLKQYF